MVKAGNSGALAMPRLRQALADGRMREPFIIAGMVVALASYYIVPSPLLALPGLLLFAVLTWRRLDLALCLLPLTFPFWYVPKTVVGHTVFPLSEIALVVCLGVALAREAARLRHGWRHGRLWIRLRVIGGWLGPWLLGGAALFALGVTIGLLIAVRPREALRAWRWEVAEPLLYLALALLYVRGARGARRLVWALLAAGALLAALALAQTLWLHATFTPLANGSRLVPYTTPGGGVPRATAFIYGSGNSLGAFLERALPLALALLLARSGFGRRARALAAGVALLCAVALLLSDSRGAEIGAAVACGVVVVVSLRRWWVGVALVASVLVVMFVARDELAALLLAGHHGSGEVRVLVWLAAWHMVRDHALFGIGPDQFLYYYSNLYTAHPYWIATLNGHPTVAAHEPTLAHPHNLALDLWLSGGLLALAGFSVALAVFWARCWKVVRRAALTRGGDAAGWRGALALGIGAAMLAGILHGMVDSAYFVPDLALIFWWSVAVLVLLERIQRRSPA
ncbi:MAG TPA: O-antigen ligase family protein [Ktedonobacterales bacterium]